MVNRLGLLISRQTLHTQLSSDPAHLVPPERSLDVQERVAVHPDRPGLQGVGYSHGLFGVRGEDGGGEAVAGVVGEFERFFFCLELADGDDGSKDL